MSAARTLPSAIARAMPRAMPRAITRAMPLTGFARWLRATSERYLMQAAQASIARRYGGRTPPPPQGVAWVWIRIYAPIYHRLPLRLRTAVIARLPGSHRQHWTYRRRPAGPAV